MVFLITCKKVSLEREILIKLKCFLLYVKIKWVILKVNEIFLSLFAQFIKAIKLFFYLFTFARYSIWKQNESYIYFKYILYIHINCKQNITNNKYFFYSNIYYYIKLKLILLLYSLLCLIIYIYVFSFVKIRERGKEWAYTFFFYFALLKKRKKYLFGDGSLDFTLLWRGGGGGCL